MFNMEEKYYNDIPDIKNIGLESYERIFKIFERSVNEKQFLSFNILKNINFPTVINDYTSSYVVPKKMSMTLISYKLYGDINSWWIIYLLNKDKFTGAPFYVEGGTTLIYLKDEIRSLVYSDITNSTIYDNRHF